MALDQPWPARLPTGHSRRANQEGDVDQASHRFCPYCGGQASATASFCANCGRPMTTQAPAAQAGTPVAVTGGGKLTEDAANCVVDDAYLAAYAHQVSDDPLFQGRVICKGASGGQAVAGSFTAPAKTSDGSPLEVEFRVSMGPEAVTVTYTYKQGSH